MAIVEAGRGAIAGAFESALHAMRCAQLVVEGFLHYNDAFREITRRAPQRFLERDWHASARDAVERIELYEQHVRSTVLGLEERLGTEARDRELWQQVKRHFDNLITGLPDAEFCKTFFSSVTRQLFGTVGVAPDIEFVAADLDPLANAHAGATTRRFAGVTELLQAHPAEARWADVVDAVRTVESAIGEHSGLEMLDAVFYHGARAYLVGRSWHGAATVPLAVALSSTDHGIVIDAVLRDEQDLSVLFGFARSYFHVDLERVADSVAFLKLLMPRKPTGELFTVLGRAKQGKTERYRSLLRHLHESEDLFVQAVGQRGLVMICFTLPSYDAVFKVIRARIPPNKNVSREEVMAKYGFVFKHDRAGRLIDAQEFRRLRFPVARFAPALLAELRTEAPDTVHEEGTDLVFDHLYIERRVTPLDVYLDQAPRALARRAVVDYGQAIRDLAHTDVFPGDLLMKNFGVTRHGRIVFYDYDELCRVSDCQFRELPTARTDEDEMSAEPWFYVDERDVFPETFVNFLGVDPELRGELLRAHGELFAPRYWRDVQRRLAAGELLEVIPYRPSA